MKKIILIFIVCLLIVSSLYAETIWKYDEFDTVDYMYKSLSAWYIDDTTELSTGLYFSKNPEDSDMLILFGSNDKFKIVKQLRIKFDNSSPDIFNVVYAKESNSFLITVHDNERFLKKLASSNYLVVELFYKNGKKINAKFYTEGLDLSLLN
jgi:hypothetical protein